MLHVTPLWSAERERQARRMTIAYFAQEIEMAEGPLSDALRDGSPDLIGRAMLALRDNILDRLTRNVLGLNWLQFPDGEEAVRAVLFNEFIARDLAKKRRDANQNLVARAHGKQQSRRFDDEPANVSAFGELQ